MDASRRRTAAIYFCLLDTECALPEEAKAVTSFTQLCDFYHTALTRKSANQRRSLEVCRDIFCFNLVEAKGATQAAVSSEFFDELLELLQRQRAA
jgi:hypothetical protein